MVKVNQNPNKRTRGNKSSSSSSSSTIPTADAVPRQVMAKLYDSDDSYDSRYAGGSKTRRRKNKRSHSRTLHR